MIKPILFNTDMVRAILEDRKTVTRRVVKPQPKGHAALLTENLLPETVEFGAGAVYAFEDGTVNSPPYRPGDILYVRETWAKVSSVPTIYAYKSNDDYSVPRWSPSIHMPREAARIFLRVTGVQVEKLQDIKPEQLRAEGFHLSFTPSECQRMFDRWGAVQNFEREKEKFASLWNSTINPTGLAIYGWDANPWVWVIEFERISRGEAMNHAV